MYVSVVTATEPVASPGAATTSENGIPWLRLKNGRARRPAPLLTVTSSPSGPRNQTFPSNPHRCSQPNQ
jgi:hypothetical protein